MLGDEFSSSSSYLTQKNGSHIDLCVYLLEINQRRLKQTMVDCNLS